MDQETAIAVGRAWLAAIPRVDRQSADRLTDLDDFTGDERLARELLREHLAAWETDPSEQDADYEDEVMAKVLAARSGGPVPVRVAEHFGEAGMCVDCDAAFVLGQLD